MLSTAKFTPAFVWDCLNEFWACKKRQERFLDVVVVTVRLTVRTTVLQFTEKARYRGKRFLDFSSLVSSIFFWELIVARSLVPILF